MADNAKKPEKLVKIILPYDRNNTDDVFVRINNRTWLIKRGIEVEVPECVVKVLRNGERANMEAVRYQERVEKKA